MALRRGTSAMLFPYTTLFRSNKFSARAGHSEHQTGLVMDVTSESVNFQLTEAFGETAEGVWIKENAHRFGFIIRYPEGKEKDRKSTRLNSSHVAISYAVFCLK